MFCQPQPAGTKTLAWTGPISSPSQPLAESAPLTTGKLSDEVTLGEYADQATLLDDWKATDFLLEHEARGPLRVTCPAPWWYLRST